MCTLKRRGEPFNYSFTRRRFIVFFLSMDVFQVCRLKKNFHSQGIFGNSQESLFGGTNIFNNLQRNSK
jgi:hypothetical protein